MVSKSTCDKPKLVICCKSYYEGNWCENSSFRENAKSVAGQMFDGIPLEPYGADCVSPAENVAQALS